MNSTPNWRVAVLLSALIIGPGAVTAQTQDQARQDTGYSPPAIRFDEGGIALLEAVRITLEHSPDIKLQEATYLFQTGVVQEQRGAFDWSFEGSVSYEYRQQELTDSVKKEEQKQRDTLDERAAEEAAFEPNVNAAIGALDNALGVNGTLLCTSCSDSLVSQYQYLTDLITVFAGTPQEAGLVQARDDLVNRERDRLVQALADFKANQANSPRSQDERDKLGDTPKDEVMQNAGFQVGLSRTFRNGIRFNPSFDTSFESNRYKGKETDPEFGGKGLEDLFNSRLGISFTFPLLRGRGSDQVAAGERSAEIERQAKLASLQHQAAESVLRTVQAYWSLRAAQDRVEVEELSVGLQERLVDVTQSLVDAGEVAGVEMARSGASMSRSQARLEDARRTLSTARVALARAMGVATTSDDATLPLASDDFPDVDASMPATADALAGIIADAIGMRRDLQAFRHIAESGQVLTRAAELDKRALLDLTAATWMTALGEKAYGKSIENWVGPSVSADLSFELPLGNNVREGRFEQSRADLRKRQIDLADLERVIELSVVNEIRALESALNAAELAQQTVGFYSSTVEAQFDLLRAGEISLVDAILTEDQQASARRDLVGARSAVARIIAQLRFETGGLISYSGDTSQVVAGALTTLPSWQ